MKGDCACGSREEGIDMWFLSMDRVGTAPWTGREGDEREMRVVEVD